MGSTEREARAEKRREERLKAVEVVHECFDEEYEGEVPRTPSAVRKAIRILMDKTALRRVNMTDHSHVLRIAVKDGESLEDAARAWLEYRTAQTE